MQNHKVGAYLRLSKEEFSNEKESNSITNQRQIINNYLKEHKEFSQEHHLNFPLLCDIENELKDAFKNHHKDVQHISRSTFILDEHGNVIKYWEKVDVNDHIEEIIKFFENQHK